MKILLFCSACGYHKELPSGEHPDRPLIQYQSYTCQPNRRGIETLQRSLVVSKIKRGKEESHFSRRKLDTPRSPFLSTCDDMPRQHGSRPPFSWFFISSSARSDIYFHRRFCQRYLDIDMGALDLQDTWNPSWNRSNI